MRSFIPLALVLVLAPIASAHSMPVSQGIGFELDPFIAYLDPNPSSLYANVSHQAFRLQILRSDIGGYSQVPAWLDLAGPQEWRANVSFRAVDNRYMVAATTLPHAGNYSVTLVLEHEGKLLAQTKGFQAYPDFGFRIQPVDPLADVFPDTRTVLAYETVHPIDLTRIDAVEDLTALVEEAAPDHSTIISATEVPMTRQGTGLWRAEHVFPMGHFFLRFASRSAGLNYSDTPLLHLEALAAQSAPPETKETPMPSGVAVVALVAVALVLARRR